MSQFLKDRERAAEGIFVREEELRFLAVRRGLQSLAGWAAEAMGLDKEAAKTYEDALVGDFLSGAPENAVVARVSTDLERAGKPAMSTTVGTTLSQAVAEATLALRGRKVSAAERDDALETWSERHKAHAHWTLS